jgi:hypothetical protein
LSNENNITIPASDMEPDLHHAPLAEKEAKGHDTRLSIHVHSVRKRLADADGISAKAAIDGLVLAGILPDDSPKYVKEVRYSQEKGEPEETIIEIKAEHDST